MRSPIQHGLAALSAFTALALAAGQAAAGATDDAPMILGAGAYTIPLYPGSTRIEVRPVPVIDVTLWDRLFVRPALGAGVYLWHKPRVDLGVSVDADLLHRYEVDDTRLAGLGNISKTARANLFITQRCGWMEATTRLSTDIGADGHGTVVDFELARSHRLTPLLNIRAGVGTTWANKQSMRTFFGVDAQQSARSGLPVFSPDSGLSSARLFFSAAYEVRPHWLIGGQIYASRLLRDAADSPITQRRMSGGGGLFFAYRVR
jgi:outer membrane protein